MSDHVHQNLIDLGKTAAKVSPSGQQVEQLKQIAENTTPASDSAE